MKKFIALAILFTFALPVFADTDFTPPTPDISPTIEKPAPVIPTDLSGDSVGGGPDVIIEIPTSGGGDAVMPIESVSWSGGNSTLRQIKWQLDEIQRLINQLFASLKS